MRECYGVNLSLPRLLYRDPYGTVATGIIHTYGSRGATAHTDRKLHPRTHAGALLAAPGADEWA